MGRDAPRLTCSGARRLGPAARDGVEAARAFEKGEHRARALADALESRSTSEREDLEFLLLASFALTIGWTLGRRAFAGALGKKPSKEFDDAFARRIDAMLAKYLDDAERRGRG